MKMYILILMGLSVAAVSFGAVGDTVSASAEKYGEPRGKFDSAGNKVRMYETPFEKITETYNSDGVCVRSVVKKKKRVKPAIKQVARKGAVPPPPPPEQHSENQSKKSASGTAKK